MFATKIRMVATIKCQKTHFSECVAAIGRYYHIQTAQNFCKTKTQGTSIYFECDFCVITPREITEFFWYYNNLGATRHPGPGQQYHLTQKHSPEDQSARAEAHNTEGSTRNFRRESIELSPMSTAENSRTAIVFFLKPNTDTTVMITSLSPGFHG